RDQSRMSRIFQSEPIRATHRAMLRHVASGIALVVLCSSVNGNDKRGVPVVEVVSIPAGSFTMGSDVEADERPAHKVTISMPFSIEKYEVTQEQFTAVMGRNPSQFEGPNLPVDRVTWVEADAFCKRLSTLTGKTFRLPTEAEWEYACRAGS